MMMSKRDEENGISKEERQRMTDQKNAEWASRHGARTRKADQEKHPLAPRKEPQEVSGTHREKRRNATQSTQNQNKRTLTKTNQKDQTRKTLEDIFYQSALQKRKNRV